MCVFHLQLNCLLLVYWGAENVPLDLFEPENVIYIQNNTIVYMYHGYFNKGS